YNIDQLLKNLETYRHVINHNKYKNNYDYYLAIYLLNKVPFYTNDFLLMIENPQPFSAVSVLHYEKYENEEALLKSLHGDDNLQSIVDNKKIEYGQAQKPMLNDYADGIDTMMFMSKL